MRVRERDALLLRFRIERQGTTRPTRERVSACFGRRRGKRERKSKEILSFRDTGELTLP